MAERQFGPYKLVRQIAVGGMAEIHLAKTGGIAGFEKYVALKMIHPNFAEDEQFIQMLVDEAKIAVQLTHGNIAQTFDLGRVGETYYITMEYVDGADLYKILRRASERELEMPLDVCAFIGKEVASALDHAHRKRDHAGKSLGIVHRDVSPQNVLVSYSGEVKLVDFGIAKATMKVRQTAVGVIKGKYYYMSPEQAWGDPIDHRSDIFSAGIVLYEMITGQMMYLEEDLHKLLEMARRAEIAPPSKLRRGVPPQLERIVMHALAKVPGERYQSAGDFATDLERFLHAYSPVFTASKLSSLLRQVVGDPIQVPDDPGEISIEFRDGVNSTHPLDDSEVAHAIDAEELRDENSVIFRVLDLDRRTTEEGPTASPPSEAAVAPASSPASPRDPAPSHDPPPPGARPSGPAERRPTLPRMPQARLSQPIAPPATPSPRPATPPTAQPAVRPSAPRTTRATDPIPVPPVRPSATGKLPSLAPARPSAKLAPPAKPRQPHEETRQLDSPAPANPLHDDSGLLTTEGDKLWGGSGDASDDLDHIGERTLITGAPGMTGMPSLFMVDAGDDADGHIEATLVTAAPHGFGGFGGFGETDSTAPPGDAAGAGAPDDDDDEDGPTLSRNVSPDSSPRPPRAGLKQPPPAALAAKIHAPAVSELRRPRPSRRTPPGGSPQPPANLLHAIVSSRSSEPMPVPRAAPPPPMSPAGMPTAIAISPPGTMPQGTVPQPMPPGAMPPGMQAMPPGMQAMPPGMQAIPPGMQAMPQPPQHAMPPGMQAMPPGTHAPPDLYGSPFPVGTPGGQPSYNHDASGLPFGIPTPPGLDVASQGGQYGGQGVHPDYAAQALATRMSPHGYPQLSPNALYQFQPSPQPAMSLTGQMRLLEVDEIPSQYKLGAARRRWFTYIVSGMLAVSVAAGVTFLIIRATREGAPTTGSVHLVSVPSGAEVTFDGTLLTDRTPLTIDGAPVGTRHRVTISLPHYKPDTQDIDIPKNGHDVSVMAQLTTLKGTILVNTVPAGAEIRINGQVRGLTPTKIPEVEIESTRTIELRHRDFPPHEVALKWQADGVAAVEYRFGR